MNEDDERTVGVSVAVGASYAAVAVALVLVVALSNPTFAPGLDFVLSAGIGTLLAGGVLVAGSAAAIAVLASESESLPPTGSLGTFDFR